jgi:hypothetical protein
VPTTKGYLSALNKWRAFCAASGTNCEQFSANDACRYIAWLSLPGDRGATLKYRTIVKYVGVLKRAHAMEHGDTAPNPCEHQQVGYLMRATRQVLGDETLCARAVTLDDLRRIIRWFGGPTPRARAARCASLLMLWGALRLGSLADDSKESDLARLCWSDVEVLYEDEVAIALRVTFRYSKTIQFRQRRHIIVLSAIPADLELCPVRAFLQAVPDNRQCCVLEEWTFASFVRELERAVPALPATPHTRGGLMGHSFRRGFVHLAREHGIGVLTIMLHGDWKDERLVRNYGKGVSVMSDLVARIYKRATAVQRAPGRQ